MPTDPEQLAPCPFCGSEDIYRYSRERMACGWCHTRGPITLLPDVSPEQRWNEQSAHRAGRVEGLREAADIAGRWSASARNEIIVTAQRLTEEQT